MQMYKVLDNKVFWLQSRSMPTQGIFTYMIFHSDSVLLLQNSLQQLFFYSITY